MVYAERYGPEGVRVNAIAPGPTETPLWLGPGGLLDQLAECRGISRDEVLKNTAEDLPAGRLATADEVAAVAIMLLACGGNSPGGAVWSVDGAHVPDVLG
jgi:NAD(P)-dependent dehydrogenase (short-subunit alcohol dehydrogenase family)